METNPRSRVVLVGASNLTRAFPLVVSRIRAAFPAPVEILAAIGHGRSYGRSSRMLFRELPGIVECGLWPALEARPRVETRTLLSDIGNDLVYGSEAAEIAGWIARLLERLAAHGARCAIARMPLASLDDLSPLRFRIARAVFYPRHAADLDVMRERARDLDRRLVGLAKERGADLVEQPRRWYGIDPVHIRRSKRAEAWSALLAPLGDAQRVVARPTDDRRALRGLRPERRRWMGRDESCEQPCLCLADGTSISLY